LVIPATSLSVEGLVPQARCTQGYPARADGKLGGANIAKQSVGPIVSDQLNLAVEIIETCTDAVHIKLYIDTDCQFLCLSETLN
jgi:hypothetical protein